MGCHFLLQGIFLTQESNPGLLHCRQILYQLNGKGSPMILLKVKSLSRVQLFATPCTVAYQAPPSMGFSRQECWSGLPFPSPRDLPDPGIEPRSPAFQADALPSEPPGKPYSPTQHKWKKNPPPPSRQRAWARLRPDEGPYNLIGNTSAIFRV